MGNQQGKTKISREPASKLSDAPVGKRIDVRFSPAVTFAVCCKPANTKLAAKQHEGGRRSVNRTCLLATNLASISPESPRNAGATGLA
jgi:hypothetical protein